MTRVVERREIDAAVANVDIVAAMEGAFQAYSAGLAVVPPVGELLFDAPPGDAHIKYGYLKGDDVFVVKIATGFYENAAKGLPSNAGLVLVFDATNGLPRAVLLDEGALTNLRTAAAGAVAAKHLARSTTDTVAVLGAGTQALMQVQMLARVRRFSRVNVWARRPEAAAALCATLEHQGFAARAATSPGDAAKSADVIITATPSTLALLDRGDVAAGAHVTAMGSDTPDKQELTAQLVASADVIVADSISQCLERGEIRHAVEAGLMSRARVVELGAVLSGSAPGRTNDDQITIADLTGVAVQDIAIAKAVLAAIGS